ncbi:MAG TPA: hypothetical protein VHX39_18360, partial [Acetobacteraceae bacterium]|nr:hypothetical protein [Acetobacteraceae bacterium]
MTQRSYHPVLRFAFGIVMALLALCSVEMAMRYLNRPRGVISGWTTTATKGPFNPFGYRGQPTNPFRATDFIVVLTGAAAVECLACPPDETLDLMLQRALRQYNPDVRVVTLGSSGYGQDQEYLALHQLLDSRHADLVIDWASFAEDVPANTFRLGEPRPGQLLPKPTFALRANDSIGPTEGIGGQVYKAKLSTLFRPMFIDLDRNWTTLLPKADPGADSPPPSAETQSHVNADLEAQRTAWSIWLTPRPARVRYGMALTHALLRHMQELSRLRGARFEILLTPAQYGPHSDAPMALVHNGHWFLADPAARDAAITEITAGFDTITLKQESGPPAEPEAERQIMARLAEALNQRGLLTEV